MTRPSSATDPAIKAKARSVRLSLEAKSAVRVACEQRVLHVLELGRKSLWTVPQLRHALMWERRKVMAKFPAWRRAASRAWYAAVVTTCGVRVRRISESKQTEWTWRRGA